MARFVALDATAQAAVNIERPGDAFGRSAIIAETRAFSSLARFVALDATAQAAVNIDRPGDAFGRSAIIAETNSAAWPALSRLMQLLRQPSTLIGPVLNVSY
jgi:hypothetical protein